MSIATFRRMREQNEAAQKAASIPQPKPKKKKVKLAVSENDAKPN